MPLLDENQYFISFFFFQAEDGIRDFHVTGVQTCALPIYLTTCEGGMAVTDDAAMAAHMRRFRNHGIDSDHRSREAAGAHAYDMAELGFNYRLPDVQCALGDRKSVV